MITAVLEKSYRMGEVPEMGVDAKSRVSLRKMRKINSENYR